MNGGRQRCSEDDVVAFLAGDYHRVVRAVAAATGDLDRAQDAVDEALVRCLVRIRSGRDIQSLPAWITTVATNHLRSRWRRLRWEVPDEGRPDAVAHVADVEDGLAVRAALGRLPRRQREVATLYYLLSFSVADVASALGVQQGTVKTQLSRARTSLREALGRPEERMTR